ncbi:thioredoxin domain-containing protein [Gelidibacter salicanalis]|uniref:Thioredoxin domain-containing protein n=1 Tax=Gelidibacter salicanalis TaxID=291193 RepID=A0A934KL51_9FLAO|nr:thioredoxin domain-containing protein [Gelidibacter salicanalis]MBJ7879219.1 thioredoxin domain-containing protein [Gelidibacter salicanalis]
MKHCFNSLFFLISILLFNCKNESSSENFEFTNALIHETSPYLLQHAHNPVNWKAWNTESLEQAKAQNKLIIVSVGYSSCHWCHVMEEESFQDEDVAKVMNENFVSIKVDREERPDIDQIYMGALELMTGSGGWPLNCICLPDGRPIFGGTYFTKDEWMQVIEKLSSLYREDPEKMIAYADKLEEGMKNADLIKVNKELEPLKFSELNNSVNLWKTLLDYQDGGDMGTEKFPRSNNLNFLLRFSHETNDTVLKNYINNSLNKMSYGGLYDQIGGGFSRYVVDRDWHIPHFEKMLYDNAQLVSVYSDAYLITKNEAYKRVVSETLNFVAGYLTHENGAFYSSLNAVSENENGKLGEGNYYIWTKAGLRQLITNNYNLFEKYYNINSTGYWENDNYVLLRNQSDSLFAKSNDITIQDLQLQIRDWHKTLLTAREARHKPTVDKKALTSWNALMLKGYVDAYRVFNNPEYLKAAIKNAQFLKKQQLKTDGSLYRTHIDSQSMINGYSEDYAYVIEAFISLYQVTLDEKWLNSAKALMDYTIDHFYNKESGMFFFTSDQDDALIMRKTETIDNATPSSNSVLAKNLFKLSHYYDDLDYKKMAYQMMNNLKPNILESPSAYSNWLDLMANYTFKYYEFVISGKNAKQDLKILNSYYLPNILIAGSVKDSEMPLLKNRYDSDETYSYVCVNGSCKLPETDVTKAIRQLKK